MPEPAKSEKETPETLFERIRSRRAGATPTAASAAGDASTAPGAGRPATAPLAQPRTAQPLRIDEILAAPGSQQGATADPRPARGAAPAPPPAGAGPFPRSATMRLLLKHPELALGLGLPAAGLILGFPRSRRLLGAAVRLGTRPEVQQAMQLTSVLRQRGRRRSRSDPESG